ncbi:MAG: hypothetical protein EA376_05415 [Phycisphaeraceae bacterium]|nr:MAG: hypothetical protein EA376_05415 [Phycisphaeraceae bacterium]
MATAVCLAIGAGQAQSAFDPAIYTTPDPAGFGTQIAELDLADTSYSFTPSGSFTSSGYVNEFNGLIFDSTELVSRVYRVDTETTFSQGAESITLQPNQLVFSYTIRLVEESPNTVFSMREFQVGLLNFVGGDIMDGSAILGRGVVTPDAGVAAPVGGNPLSFEDLGMFGSSLDFEWPTGDLSAQLGNEQSITLLMFSRARPIGEGLGTFIAPAGQQTGVDPIAGNMPTLIPLVPGPGAAALFGLAGLIGLRRTRGG